MRDSIYAIDLLLISNISLSFRSWILAC